MSRPTISKGFKSLLAICAIGFINGCLPDPEISPPWFPVPYSPVFQKESPVSCTGLNDDPKNKIQWPIKISEWGVDQENSFICNGGTFKGEPQDSPTQCSFVCQDRPNEIYYVLYNLIHYDYGLGQLRVQLAGNPDGGYDHQYAMFQYLPK